MNKQLFSWLKYYYDNMRFRFTLYILGLVRDCSNSSVLAMELLQFRANPLTYI